ncbi:MAG: hypothetical protein QW667_00120 [Candidatus Bathyarchaeia archaeon]
MTLVRRLARVGLIIGDWILATGEFFEYRYAAGMLVLIGGIISIIVD